MKGRSSFESKSWQGSIRFFLGLFSFLSIVKSTGYAVLVIAVFTSKRNFSQIEGKKLKNTCFFRTGVNLNELSAL